MAALNFYVEKNYKNPERNKRPQSVKLYLSRPGKKRLRIRTGIKIAPAYWDADRQEARGYRGSVDFNNRLTRMLPDLLDLLAAHVHKSDEAVVLAFESYFLSPAMPLGFMDIYNLFMDERAKTHAVRTIAKYKSLKFALELFQSDTRHPLTFVGMDAHFYDRFTDYLRTKKKPLLDDSISKYISNLKTFMDWAFERGHHSTSEYRKFAAKRLPRVEIVTLTMDEVALIKAHSASCDRLDRVRDLFLFLIYTGQRVSDLMAFDRSQIVGNRWVFEAEKTKAKKKVISVPFVGWCAPALDILQKYDYCLPRISEQKLNDYLKDLGKEIGLTRRVTKRRFRGSQEIGIAGPLYEFMSSHMARRTCITMLIKKGVPLPILQKLTGHSDVKTLMKYENTGADDLEEALAKV